MLRIVTAFRRALVLAALLAPAAGAQPINVSTGINGGGAVLADGAADPFWTISVQGGAFNPAVVLFPIGQCCGMETVNAAAARWISDQSSAVNAGTGWGIGPEAVLRRTFDLTGYDLSSVSLTGDWRIADGLVGLFLNGNLIASSPAFISSNWGSDHPLSVLAASGFFVAGVNTIEARATSGNSTWDGLYLNASVAGQQISAVPEPASVALVATGAVVLLGVARRRRTA